MERDEHEGHEPRDHVGPPGCALTTGCGCDTILRMSLLRGLFWVLLFVFFAFSFVVLFEYGTADFKTGFVKEFEKAKTFVIQAARPEKEKDKK